MFGSGARLSRTGRRRPVVAETTALGAAYLAGLAVGYLSDQTDVAQNWALDREFIPAMPDAERESHAHLGQSRPPHIWLGEVTLCWLPIQFTLGHRHAPK